MLYSPPFKICKEGLWASAQVDLPTAGDNVAHVRESLLTWEGKRMMVHSEKSENLFTKMQKSKGTELV